MIGLKVITPSNTRLPHLSGVEATISYIDEDGGGTRVMLSCGYFWELKTLTFVNNKAGFDPTVYAKCIQKYGSLYKALKHSLK